jgi:hypothetical protein
MPFSTVSYNSWCPEGFYINIMGMQPLFFFAANCEKPFFGLVPWYHYLYVDPGTCEIPNFNFLGGDIPLVLLAIIDDLLRIAGIVAIAFVLYGAIQYIASQGSPEATAKAQGTIINALIGMAVAMVSVAFVSFLGNQLGG